MKKTVAILLLGLLLGPGLVTASNNNNSSTKKDTIQLKCLLFCPNLFYGIELGEKPVKDIVDTLVSEIPYYDTAQSLKLVIISAKDLGFTNESDISWDEILDSADSRGYGACPPQLGPELLVLSQNLMKNQAILNNDNLKGKPLFIGMDKLRHINRNDRKPSTHSIFKRKNYYDFIFCVKENTKSNLYELGYSITDTPDDDKDFVWNSNDLFIFLSKGN